MKNTHPVPGDNQAAALGHEAIYRRQLDRITRDCLHVWRGSGISGDSVVRHCLKCGDQKLVPRSGDGWPTQGKRLYPTLEETELLKAMVKKHKLRDY